MKAWFFKFKKDRKPDDINNLWYLYETAINFADNPSKNNKEAFIKIFNIVTKSEGIKWNITIGLYWIRPLNFLNLDGRNRPFLLEYDNANSIGIKSISDLEQLPDGDSYLQLIDICKNIFMDKNTPFHSFPHLSLLAWLKTTSGKEKTELKKKTSVFDRKLNEEHFWMYAPGKGANKWEEYYPNGIMGIGWDSLGDLSRFSSREEIREKMIELSGESNSYRNDSLALWQFSHDIKIGDIIYVKRGMFEIIGRGIVESDYKFIPERNEHKHIRQVKWTHEGKWEHPGQAVLKTLTDITYYTDYVRKLEFLITEEDIPGNIKFDKKINYDVYTEEDFLDEVFMEPEQYETIVDLLKYKKNLILQGAPGVGKTFIAERLAYSIIGTMDTDRVNMIQFHQSYSYEDFIMGFRPVKNGFDLEFGPFYKFCKKAEDDIERKYFFIIDEINRSNLSKVFGELLMLIENDKRGKKLRLLYRDELFSVPENVHIIGLMNTADRSLAMIDYALRRRFVFFDIEPAFDSFGFQAIIENSDNSKQFKHLINRIKELNEVISKDESLGDGFRIGHSYFCQKSNKTSIDWLDSVIKYEIIPLLNEYWFDEKSKIEEWKGKLNGTLK